MNARKTLALLLTAALLVGMIPHAGAVEEDSQPSEETVIQETIPETTETEPSQETEVSEETEPETSDETMESTDEEGTEEPTQESTESVTEEASVPVCVCSLEQFAHEAGCPEYLQAETGNFKTISGKLKQLKELYDHVTAANAASFHKAVLDTYAMAFSDHNLLIKAKELDQLDAVLMTLEKKMKKSGFLPSQPSAISGKRAVRLSKTAENPVETAKRVNADDKNNLYLTLEAYLTGEVFDIPVPSDIVLVVDQSASMYIPMGCSGYWGNNELLPLTSSVSRHRWNEIEAGTLSGSFTQLGYLVAQSNLPDAKGNYDWYVVQKAGDQWHFYRTPNNSTPSGDHDSWSGSENGPVLKKYPGEIGVGEFHFYKTQYSALYDALTAFVRELHSTGINHRLAVAGFSGGVSMGNCDGGSGVYIGSSWHPFARVGQTAESYSQAYANGILTDEVYGNAMVSIRDGYDSILSSIRAIRTDYYNTEHNIGLYMASRILSATPEKLPSDETDRSRAVILFTDGAPSPAIGTADQIRQETVSQASALKAPSGGNAQVHVIATSTLSESASAFLRESVSAGSNFRHIATADELTGAFREVILDVGEASISLDDSTILQDMLSAEFTIPDSIADSWDSMTVQQRREAIPVYISDCLGQESGSWCWKEPVAFPADISLIKSQNGCYQIQVTGFDYSSNFVSANGRDKDGFESQSFHGRKLMVRIPVVASKDNPGGTGMPTNTPEKTGIYKSDGVKVADFGLPTVDLPVKVTVRKKVIGAKADPEKDFSVSLKAPSFTTFSDDGALDGNHLKAEGEMKIYNFAISASDVGGYSAENILMGEERYLLLSEKTQGTGYELTGVTASCSGQMLTAVQLPDGSWKIPVSGPDIQITLENTIQTADLTIVKELALPFPDQSFLFLVSGENISIPVILPEEGFLGKIRSSVTISDLPVGTYTVTEDTAWSWRYLFQSVQTLRDGQSAANGASVTFTLTPEGETVIFRNRRENDFWRDGETYGENRFTAIAAKGGNQR